MNQNLGSIRPGVWLEKSSRSLAISGIRWYLCTLYPAPVSRLSLASSLSSRPAWDESSSSITAITFSSPSQSTKSATLRLKPFRTDWSREVSSALKATCDSTKKRGAGNAEHSIRNNSCSRRVSGGRAVGGIRDVYRLLPFFLVRATTKKSTNKPTINQDNFTGTPSFGPAILLHPGALL